MTIIVTGPSSVGKSTFLKSPTLRSLGIGERPVVFGYELADRDAPAFSLVHYNLLHYALEPHESGGDKESGLLTEPIFRKILEGRPAERAIVIVTSLSNLRKRMQGRTLVEEHLPDGRYDRRAWLEISSKTDFFRLYELLFSALDAHGIPFEVYHSHDGIFDRSDRVFVHAILKGGAPRLPSREAVQKVVADPNCQYQAVLLPFGQATSRRGYDHVGPGRYQTIDKVLRRNLASRSILDVGCAMGELLFAAERLGARRLTGIERNAARYTAAVGIRDVLQSEVRLLNCDFVDCEFNEQYDDVFVLNVLHHAFDFYRLVKKAAGAAKATLTIEFPTLMDRKFREVHDLAAEQTTALDKLPVIGLSSRAVDQSLVYSPVAVRELVMREIGGFSKCSLMPSPIADRFIAIFDR